MKNTRLGLSLFWGLLAGVYAMSAGKHFSVNQLTWAYIYAALSGFCLITAIHWVVITHEK